MISWLGPGLACTYGLMAVHRGIRRELPGSAMAAGMGLMSLGMAGVGPLLVSGPWWAAGFAAVTVWPLVRTPRGRVGGAMIAHLLGGVAMIYMCALPAMSTMGGVEAAQAADQITPVPTGHAMAGMGPVDLTAVPTTVPGPLVVAAAVLGWALACYFLLGTITALTRRNTDGAPATPTLAALDQAAMGFGTVVMLAAFS